MSPAVHLISDRIMVPADSTLLTGDLVIADDPIGLVLFAHGSGSSRRSPRNRQVASALNDAHMATILLDLLSEREARERSNVFDIRLLASRLVTVTRWVAGDPRLRELPIGYFGASTGAAAAIIAAAKVPSIAAVVSRGGRPDLAGDWLRLVKAPALLIVGGNDEPVVGMNRVALSVLSCPKELTIVPGATHLFEEPGCLEEVSRLAAEWFTRHFPKKEDSHVQGQA